MRIWLRLPGRRDIHAGQIAFEADDTLSYRRVQKLWHHVCDRLLGAGRDGKAALFHLDGLWRRLAEQGWVESDRQPPHRERDTRDDEAEEKLLRARVIESAGMRKKT